VTLVVLVVIAFLLQVWVGFFDLPLLKSDRFYAGRRELTSGGSFNERKRPEAEIQPQNSR
jgi:hypothetical protein